MALGKKLANRAISGQNIDIDAEIKKEATSKNITGTYRVALEIAAKNVYSNSMQQKQQQNVNSNLIVQDTRFENKRPSDWQKDYETKHFKDRPEHKSAINNDGFTKMTTPWGEEKLTHKQVMDMHHRIDAENKAIDKMSSKVENTKKYGMSI
jgi:hypothetical protein